ncbi:MAG: phospho-N-acetylmuramoyl-pentapeptide-transferase [Nitrospinae bacterium]|nr:phospho-N-acetylmuramoyl-pentapeptide-transferase [Nitrospinota bacterium]MBI3815230.1 phospho-N-acetylmuramoyl-pentapeptide-transferase [Nitrospinota bacterium]
MLYHLLFPLHETYSVFNVFRYITFRTAYAILTALIISFIFGPWIIKKLKEKQIGERIREDVPRSHQSKAGTPTMGGIMILFALFVPTLLWADLTNKYVWLVMFSTLSFGLIGFADDYLKLKNGSTGSPGKRKDGLKGKEKFAIQVAVAAIIVLFLYFDKEFSLIMTKLGVPFFKNIKLEMDGIYILFAVLVIVGTSNAVNLTDGLDGLAIGPIIIATTAYMIIAYITGHFNFANYLNIQHIRGAGELAIFCGAAVGASLGFLWFNSYPAQVFMGNVGSTALGGMLGTVAVITKQELILLIIGGIFVVEALSVILQVASFKLTGKRIFKMAPLHHHFEMSGWEEPKVIVRFWIIAIILALLSLSTLKLR